MHGPRRNFFITAARAAAAVNLLITAFLLALAFSPQILASLSTARKNRHSTADSK